MLDLRRAPGSPPLLVAHRGASGLAPENTMAAFELAVQGGADIIELDVRLSADGHVVVIHDDRLQRTTNGRGAVVSTALAELQTLDAGTWFDPRFANETIPTLAQVLTWARGPDPPMTLMIELKGDSQTLACGLVEKSVQLIAEREMREDVMLISFYHPCLTQAKAVAPDIATGTIVRLSWFDQLLARVLRVAPLWGRVRAARQRLLRPLTLSRAVGADSLSIPARALTSALVKAAHAAGLAVSPGGRHWDYPAVIAMGADTISADDPAAVRATYLTP